MSTRYTKQTWVNDETVINATRMNHIEDGIEAIDNALENIESSTGNADTLDGKHATDFYLKTDTIDKSNVSTKTGNGYMTIQADEGASVNFGGSYNSNAIYFGSRATDSKSKPSKYFFGGAAADADIYAKDYHGKVNGIRTYVQEAEPTNPNVGDLWIW